MWCHKGQVDEGGIIQSKSLIGIPPSSLPPPPPLPIPLVGHSWKLARNDYNSLDTSQLCRDFEKRGKPSTYEETVPITKSEEKNRHST